MLLFCAVMVRFDTRWKHSTRTGLPTKSLCVSMLALAPCLIMGESVGWATDDDDDDDNEPMDAIFPSGPAPRHGSGRNSYVRLCECSRFSLLRCLPAAAAVGLWMDGWTMMMI